MNILSGDGPFSLESIQELPPAEIRSTRTVSIPIIIIA